MMAKRASTESELRELGIRLLVSCDKGDEEEVKRLLKHKEKDRFINQRDKQDESALFKAAKRGYFEIAQLLVRHGVDVNSIKDSDVQLRYVATEHGHTKQMVIDPSSAQVGTKSLLGPVSSDPSYVKRVNGMSALMIASMNGDTKTARLLLEHGADVHIKSTVSTERVEWSALMFACRNGRTQIVKLLLEYKAEFRNTSKRYLQSMSAALIVASQNGHHETVELLLEQGADVDTVSDVDIVSDVESDEFQPKIGTALMMASKNGDKKMIELLLKYKANVNLQAKHSGWTALMFASHSGHTESATLLLEHGADVHAKFQGWTALLYACKQGQTQTVKLLLKYKAEVCVQTMFTKVSALVVASQNGHHDTAEVLLKQGADVDVGSESGKALIIASKNGDKKMIELLLQHGAKVDFQACKDMHCSGWTALMFASDRGHTESSKLLLEQGADVDIQGYEKSVKDQEITLTALMIASRKGYTQIAKLLLDHKATKDMQNNEGMTALMFATTNKKLETVELLLEHGADANIQNNEGMTALMLATNNQKHEIFKLLLEHEADTNIQNNKGMTALMIATTNQQNHETVELLLEHGTDTNIQNNEGMTALMIATNNQKHEAVKLLLKHEADTNIQNNEGMSALMIATTNQQNHETVELLLEHEADTNIQNNEGMTALMIATTNQQNHETFELLLEHGADTNIQSNEGMTALMLASQNGHIKITKTLLEYESNVNALDKRGWSALMIASKMGRTEVCELLLKQGADINIQDGNGLTAFLIASQNGHTKIIKVLLAYPDIDVNMLFNGKTSALMSAAQNGHTETVKVLLDHGADVDLQNDEGMSALMASAQNGHSETVKILLEYKATVNLQKKSGWTALMFLISTSKEHPKLVQLLLENGANKSINVQGRDGRTALTLACNNRYTEVAELLLNHGAGVNIQKLNGLSALMIASQNGDINTVNVLLKYGADVTLKDDAGITGSMIARQCCSLKLAELLEKQESTLLASSSLSASTLTTVLDTIHHIRPEDLTVKTCVVVTNSEQHYSWHEYGVNIHIPKNSLPEGVQQCSIHIKASLALEGLQLPQDTHLVSAVYSFKCSPKCQFSKRLTLEIQHCAKLEYNKELCFVRAISGSKLQVLQCGDPNIFYSHFPRHTSYGFVELDKFCKYCVGQKGVDEIFYRANIYRYGIDQRHHKFHFNIVLDTNAHNEIVSEHYRRQDMILEVDQRVEFEETQICLDIPFPSTEGIKATFNDSWRIMSLSPPMITKVEVDYFKKGRRIPSCQLVAKCEGELTDLMHSVQLKGAKYPYNAFLIRFCVPNTRKRTLDDQGDKGTGQKHPRTSTLEMSFTTVLRELSSKVSADWEDVGLFLGLGLGRLDIIKADNPSDCQKCFREMIKVWFKQQVDPPPSWSAMVEALDVLGHNSLAQNLREKYQILF